VAALFGCGGLDIASVERSKVADPDRELGDREPSPREAAELAHARHTRGDPLGALLLLERAERTHANVAVLRVLRARSLLQLRREAEALQIVATLCKDHRATFDKERDAFLDVAIRAAKVLVAAGRFDGGSHLATIAEAAPTSAALRQVRLELHRRHGEVLFRAWATSAAIEAYRRAMALGDPLVETPFELGRALWSTGQGEEGERAFDEAIARAPVAEKNAWRLKVAAFHQDNRRPARAAEVLRVVLQTAPEDPLVRRRLLEALARSANWKALEADLERFTAGRSAAERGAIEAEVAAVLLATNAHARASALFERMRLRDPGDVTAWIGLFESLRRARDARGMDAVVSRAIGEKALGAAALAALAERVVAAGDLARGLALLAAAAARQGAAPQAWLDAARLASRQRDRAKRDMALSAWVKAANDKAAAHVEAARLLVRDGDPGAALVHAREAVREDEHGWETAAVLADVLRRLGRLDEEEASLGRWASRHKEPDRARLQAAARYVRVADPRRAEAWFERVAVNPTLAEEALQQLVLIAARGSGANAVVVARRAERYLAAARDKVAAERWIVERLRDLPAGAEVRIALLERVASRAADPSLHFQLGLARAQRGALDLAYEAFDRYVESATGPGEGAERVVERLADRGSDTTFSIFIIRHPIIASKNTMLLRRVASWLGSAGYVEPARRYWRRYLSLVSLPEREVGAVVSELLRLRQFDLALDALYRASGTDETTLAMLQAEALLGLGRMEQAVRTLDRWIEVSPNKLQARLRAATRLAHAGRLEAAAQRLLPMIGPGAGGLERHAFRALVDVASRAGRLEWVRQAMSAWPDARSQVGLLAEAGLCNDALAAFKQAQRAGAWDPGLAPLARCLVEAGRVAEGVAEYTLALKARGAPPGAVMEASRHLERVGAVDAAISLLDRHTSAVTSESPTRTELGGLLLRAGRIPQARRVLEVAVDLAPRPLQVIAEVLDDARLALASREIDALLERASAGGSSRGELLLLRARVAVESGDLAGARKLFVRAAATGRASPLEVANGLIGIGAKPDALRVLREALAADGRMQAGGTGREATDAAGLTLALGLALEAGGEAQVRALLRLHAGGLRADAELAGEAADALAARGMWRLALALSRDAARALPDDLLVGARLGLRLAAAGLADEAFEALRRALGLEVATITASRPLRAWRASPVLVTALSALRSLGHSEEAVATAREIAVRRPDSGSAWALLVSNLVAQGKATDTRHVALALDAALLEASALPEDVFGAALDQAIALLGPTLSIEVLAARVPSARAEPWLVERLATLVLGHASPQVVARQLAALRELADREPRVALALAQALTGAGRASEAGALFERAVLEADAGGRAVAAASWCRSVARLGGTEAVRSAARRIAALTDGDLQTALSLARVLVETGHARVALEQLDPDRPALGREREVAEARFQAAIAVGDDAAATDALSRLARLETSPARIVAAARRAERLGRPDLSAAMLAGVRRDRPALLGLALEEARLSVWTATAPARDDAGPELKLDNALGRFAGDRRVRLQALRAWLDAWWLPSPGAREGLDEFLKPSESRVLRSLMGLSTEPTPAPGAASAGDDEPLDALAAGVASGKTDAAEVLRGIGPGRADARPFEAWLEALGSQREGSGAASPGRANLEAAARQAWAALRAGNPLAAERLRAMTAALRAGVCGEFAEGAGWASDREARSALVTLYCGSEEERTAIERALPASSIGAAYALAEAARLRGDRAEALRRLQDAIARSGAAPGGDRAFLQIEAARVALESGDLVRCRVHALAARASDDPVNVRRAERLLLRVALRATQSR